MGAYLKSLDDFLLQAKASGKKWASGTITTASSGLTYTWWLNNAPSSGNGAYITVSGLTFIPTIIFVYNNGSMTAFINSSSAIKLFAIYAGGALPKQYDYPQTNVTIGTTFQVPANNVAYNTIVTWIAIE